MAERLVMRGARKVAGWVGMTAAKIAAPSALTLNTEVYESANPETGLNLAVVVGSALTLAQSVLLYNRSTTGLMIAAGSKVIETGIENFKRLQIRNERRTEETPGFSVA